MPIKTKRGMLLAATYSRERILAIASEYLHSYLTLVKNNTFEEVHNAFGDTGYRVEEHKGQWRLYER